MEKVDLLLINPFYHKRNGSGAIFPLGLGYISKKLRDNGFSVKIIDCALYFKTLNELPEFLQWFRIKISKIDPYIIGIGPSTTPAIRSIIEINKICREIHSHKPIIFGGPLASINSQQWIFKDILKADGVVSGDGEQVMLNIIKYLKSNRVKKSLCETINDLNKDEVKHDFFESDIPERSFNILYKPSIRRNLFKNPFATLIGSKGCPRSCSFCVSSTLNRYRKRSFESIIREMKFLYENKNIKSFIFYDDCFFSNKNSINQEIESFTKQIIANKINASWQIELPPDMLYEIDYDNLKNLINSGCRQFNIGFERNDNLTLNLFNKSYDFNKIKNKCDEIFKIDSLFRINGTFILTGPNSSFNKIRDLIYFSKNLNLLFAHYNPLFLYPGTILYDNLFPKQPKKWFEIISKNEDFFGEILYQDKNLNRKEIFNQIQNAYCSFYDSKWELKARKIFKNNYNYIQGNINKMKIDRFNQYD